MLNCQLSAIFRDRKPLTKVNIVRMLKCLLSYIFSRQKTLIILCLLVAGLLQSGPLSGLVRALEASSDSIAIVVNESNEEVLSQKQLKLIFLGRNTVWDSSGLPIKVVLQPREVKSSKVFNKLIFKDKGRRLARQWVKNIITGAAPAPITEHDDNYVLEQISKEKSAIGYIMLSSLQDSEPTEGVRVALIINVE